MAATKTAITQAESSITADADGARVSLTGVLVKVLNDFGGESACSADDKSHEGLWAGSCGSSVGSVVPFVGTDMNG